MQKREKELTAYLNLECWQKITLKKASNSYRYYSRIIELQMATNHVCCSSWLVRSWVHSQTTRWSFNFHSQIGLWNHIRLVASFFVIDLDLNYIVGTFRLNMINYINFVLHLYHHRSPQNNNIPITYLIPPHVVLKEAWTWSRYIWNPSYQWYQKG